MTAQARRHANVVNCDEVNPGAMEKGKHRLKMRRVGAAAGGQMLGATVVELAPGSISFPFHYHCATEEAIYVLSGEGVARIGGERIPVRAGDWIAMPPGPAHAHQMINESDAAVTYLCVSAAVQKVDVVGYPDSHKVAATAGTWEKPIHRWISREGESLDYWEGEPDAK
jgi:uncharacterized cupin superfamily protein